MTFLPAQQLSTPFEDQAGFFLKCFVQGTTTPISMATDSTGDTLLAKAEISSGGAVPIGFIKTAGDAIFQPYLDQPYDAWLFPTASEANVNDTSNAIKIADNIALSRNGPAEFSTIADMVSATNLSIGDFIIVENYSATIPSGVMFFEVVAAGTGPADGGAFINLDTDQARQNFNNQRSTAEQWGAASDGTDASAAILSALATGRRIVLPSDKTFDVTATIEISDSENLILEANTILRGSVSPVVRFHGEHASVTGQDSSSQIVQLPGVASDQGVVKIGHNLITDNDTIGFNKLWSLRIVGDDPFGTNATHRGVDTIGVMMLNLGDFNQNPAGNGSVFFNQIGDLLIEDVKEAVLETSSVNATMGNMIYFRRLGRYGFHNFSPDIADGAGVRYGVDWNNPARLEGACSENTFDQVFIADSFFAGAKGTTTGTSANKLVDASGEFLTDIVVGDIVQNLTDLTTTTVAAIDSNTQLSINTDIMTSGESYSVSPFNDMASIRLEFKNAFCVWSNLLVETGSRGAFAPTYNIDVETTDCRLEGAYNVGDVGPNNSITTTILDRLGVDRWRENLRIDNALLDNLIAQFDGTVSLPWMHSATDLTTGIYWSTDGEMNFATAGVETVKFDSSGVNGNVNVDGSNVLRLGTFSNTGASGGWLSGTGATTRDLSSSTTLSTLVTHMAFYNSNGGGGQVGAIQTNAGATIFLTTSDPRWKSEFDAFDPVKVNAKFDDILACSGTFNWLSDPDTEIWGFNAHKAIDLGLDIASEGFGPRDMTIGDVYEDAVMGTRPKMISVMDGEGNASLEDSGETEEYEIEPAKIVSPAGIDQSKVTPYLVAKIALQDQVIAALTARLDAAGI